ncbi:MAG: hypothetical protein PHV37_02995 [Candidatus Gastranaerophilales bacterium]|nr:hypothetical protein [Candidatus Gastranaerophilales bacterium]
MTTSISSISANYADLFKLKSTQGTDSSDINIPLNGSGQDGVTDAFGTSNAVKSTQIESMVSSLVQDAAHMEEDASENSLRTLKTRLNLIQTMGGDDIDVASILNKALAKLPVAMQKRACETLGVPEPENDASIDSQNFSPVTKFQAAVGKMPSVIRNAVDKTTNAVNTAFSNASAPNINAEGATQNGAKLAQVASQTASSMGSHGWCLKGVNNSLEKMYGFRLGYPSAYMAADGLRQHSDQFKEVSASKADLDKLPAGAIVVWDKDGDNPHGHISISLGNGYEASDHVAKQYKNISNSFTVFIPQD